MTRLAIIALLTLAGCATYPRVTDYPDKYHPGQRTTIPPDSQDYIHGPSHYHPPRTLQGRMDELENELEWDRIDAEMDYASWLQQ